MKGKKHKEYVIEIAKKLILFGLLLIMTLVLLEIPQKLFQKSEARLLKEKGGSVYELKAVENDMLLFSEKLKMLVNDSPVTDVQYLDAFNKDEIMLEEVALADEIDLLLGEAYPNITSALRNGKLESKGFTIEIKCNIEKTEYAWKLGTLFFEEEQLIGELIYDFSSKKLFYLNMFDYMMIGDDKTENDLSNSVMEYYKGLDVQWAEATLRLAPDINVFPTDFNSFSDSIIYYYLKMACAELYSEGEQEIELPEYFYNH